MPLNNTNYKFPNPKIKPSIARKLMPRVGRVTYIAAVPIRTAATRKYFSIYCQIASLAVAESANTFIVNEHANLGAS